MSKARAEIEITASDSRLASGLNSARSKWQTFASSIARSNHAMSSSFKMPKMVGAGATALGNFGGSMLTRGFDKVSEAATEVRDFERSLVRFQIVAKSTPEAMRDFRTQINGISEATAISREKILAGAQAYVDITGDVKGANAQLSMFARAAQASDSDIMDIARAGAAMQDAMKLPSGEVEAALSGLINQGKEGAVTMKDFAGEMPGLLSRFARFGVLGKEGVLQIGGMFQVVRKGFPDAAEAATGLQAMMGGMIKHADRFHHAGVDVFDIGKDGTKTLKPMSNIIEQIGKSKLAKDPQLLNKAFGRGEGEQAYQMLKGHVDMLRQMEEAGKDAGTVQRDLATFMTSDAGRIDGAFNKIKLTIAEVFTPDRILAFAHAMEDLATSIKPLVDFLGKAGDVLGGAYEAGKKGREAISGGYNPFNPGHELGREGGGRAEGLKAVLDPLGLFGKSVGQRDREEKMWNAAQKLAPTAGNRSGISDPEMHRLVGIAQERDAFDVARKQIEGAKGPVASTLQASIASLSDRGPGAQGTMTAGNRYLIGAGVQHDQAQEIYAKAMAEAMKEVMQGSVAQELAAAIKEGFSGATPPTVKIGDNQVAKSVNNATAPRTRPGT